MATSEVSSEDKRTALILKGLIQGRDVAKQLQVLLGNPVRKDGFAAADGYMEKILRSFSESIDRISDDSSDHPNRIWKKSRSYDSEGEDHRGGGSEGSNECKKRPHASSLTDKRVCYKRRRSSEARTKVSPTMEDGQAWRKYGQKIILNAKFPRSYFRCTHKYDQGCKATKQVQSMEDNPQLYHITYIDYHTCNGMLKGPKLIASETDVHHHQQQQLKIDNLNQRDNFSLDLCTSSQAAAVKEEHKEQDTKSDLTDNIDSFLQPDIMDFELSSVSQMFSLGTLDDVTSHDFDNLFLNDGDFS